MRFATHIFFAAIRLRYVQFRQPLPALAKALVRSTIRGFSCAGKRGAAVMSLVHSARLNGHDPYAYLKDVLERLPTQPASRIGELLPHRWQITVAAN